MRGRDKCRRWAMRNIRTISTGWAELEVGSMFGAYLHNGTIVAATNRWSAHATAKRLEQVPRRSRTGYDIDRGDRDGPVELTPKIAVPTQNTECRRNSRISLTLGVLSRDKPQTNIVTARDEVLGTHRARPRTRPTNASPPPTCWR